MKGTIVQVFDFTFSCVMAIVPEHPHPQERLILKLYDRRFATDLRSGFQVPPCTVEIEQDYQRFFQDGKATAFLAELRSDEDSSDSEGDGEDGSEDESEECVTIESKRKSWNAAQHEVYLLDQMLQIYGAECKA
jgi:hypothetical protein